MEDGVAALAHDDEAGLGAVPGIPRPGQRRQAFYECGQCGRKLIEGVSPDPELIPLALKLLDASGSPDEMWPR